MSYKTPTFERGEEGAQGPMVYQMKFSLFSNEMARLHYPLLFKSLTRGQEPLQHKGGLT